jgi:hypothetical protein
MYQHILTESDFNHFCERAGKCFNLDQRMPGQLFKPEYGRFRMTEAPDGNQDELWPIIKTLLGLTGAQKVWCGVVFPELVVASYLARNSCYPVFQISAAASEAEYYEAIHGPRGGGGQAQENCQDVYTCTEQILWLSDDQLFAMCADIYSETFIMAFHKKLELPDCLRKQWFYSVKKFTDEVLYPGPTDPEGLNCQLAITYRTDDE